jgi:hypothetical protein
MVELNSEEIPRRIARKQVALHLLERVNKDMIDLSHQEEGPS